MLLGFASSHNAQRDPITVSVLRQIQARNLAPALAWADTHREQLRARDERGAQAFEFQLHRLQFLHTLQQQGAACAFWLSGCQQWLTVSMALRYHACALPSAVRVWSACCVECGKQGHGRVCQHKTHTKHKTHTHTHTSQLRYVLWSKDPCQELAGNVCRQCCLVQACVWCVLRC